MISISTIDANSQGNVILHVPSSSFLGAQTARVVQVPTLDGGAVLIHSGVSENDCTPRVKTRIPENKAVHLMQIFRLNSYVLISVENGVFLSVIKTLNIDNGQLDMSVLIHGREV